ncbi:hypothetical protein H0H93_000207 [Arthromyces matolae]|nr:hypothetical protein H0H93_000207 [Arthromyces matolae]
MHDISTANYTNIRVNVTPNADKSRVVTEIKYITKTKWVAANAEATAGIPLEEGFQDTQPTRPLPLENHKYQPNGLLEVNPNGPHPIFELIRTAEAAWDNKLAKASKTLGEAVTEYKRRYKRAPPKGFDAWWDYVQKHNVLLPDDYDQINEDLLPFWGMDPEDVRRTQFEWEGHSDSYTVGKTSSSAIHVVNYSLPGNEHSGHDLLGGAYEVMELLKDVEEHIPPFRAVFSPHDNPDLPTDWELKRMALDHAEAASTSPQATPHSYY